MQKISYAGYRFPPEVIHQAIWLYLRFTLSFRVTLRPEFEVGPGGLKAGFGMVSGLGASWSASEVGSVRRRRADRAG